MCLEKITHRDLLKCFIFPSNVLLSQELLSSSKNFHLAVLQTHCVLLTQWKFRARPHEVSSGPLQKVLLKSPPSLHLKSQLHHCIRPVFSGHWRLDCDPGKLEIHAGKMLIAVLVELFYTVAVFYPAPQQISRVLCLQQELMNLSADHHTPTALAELLGVFPTHCWMQFQAALVSSYRPLLNTHWGLFAAPHLKTSRKSGVDAKGWQRMLQLGAEPSVPAASTAGEEPWAS